MFLFANNDYVFGAILMMVKVKHVFQYAGKVSKQRDNNNTLLYKAYQG